MDQIYDELRAALHSIWHRRWLALVPGAAVVALVKSTSVDVLTPG